MEAANHTNANNAVNVTTIALSLIQPSGFNPRKSFDEQALTELADSIRQHGVIQPVGLRPIPGTDRYEIVFGERRYRASLIAEQTGIPAEIYDNLSDKEAEEMAITENLQRQDIAPMEEASAFRRLIESGRYDAQSLAVQVGKSVAYIRTRMKLTTLIPEIASLLDTDDITVSVASEICRYGEDIQREVYEKHLKDGLPYNSWRGMNASKVAQMIERDFTTELCRYSFDNQRVPHAPTTPAICSFSWKRATRENAQNPHASKRSTPHTSPKRQYPCLPNTPKPTSANTNTTPTRRLPRALPKWATR